MKQTIPFKKDITFKTKIGELTAISLDNDLTLKGEDLIVGNFYISGNYKMHEGSITEEEYSYKIPCEIAISDEYDTYDATIDIDDFYYEIINDEILRVNITVILDNLEKKEEFLKKEDRSEEIEVLTDESKEETEKKVFEDEINLSVDNEFKEIEILDKSNNDRITSFYETKEKVKKQTDTFLTYKVYIFKEADTIESILEKYNITKEDLSDYNNLEEIKAGSKLVIPSSND